QLLAEPGQREVVARLGPLDRGGAVVGAELALDQLLLGLERLAALAVPALVGAAVNMPVIVYFLYEFTAALVVARLAGLDEVVVADFEGLPDLLELPGHVVAVGLRAQAEFAGLPLDLDRVLVVAHQEVDVKTLHAAVAGLDVGAELLEGGADVRPAVGVVDGGGQVETRRFGHGNTVLPAEQKRRKRQRTRAVVLGRRRRGGRGSAWEGEAPAEFGELASRSA